MDKLVRCATGKDFTILEKEVADNKDSIFVIYGCGVNGEVFFGYLHMLGFEISYFIDKQADVREFAVLNKKVISPSSFVADYTDEKVIISPDDNDEIYRFLIDSGIPHDNIILPFAEKAWNIIDAEHMDHCSTSITYKKSFNRQQAEATFVSIIYNTPEGLLRRAIESVLRQTAENFTYLIIDNGTTDYSSEIIKQYQELDDRIVCIRLNDNVLWTNSVLLNILTENIHGKYVCTLDSDDYYENTFLEKTLTIACESGADLIQVNTLTYPEGDFKYPFFTQTLKEDTVLLGEKLLLNYCLRILNVTFWGKLYTRELFQKLLSTMLTFDESDRKERFLLDISWMSAIVENTKEAYICNEILHIRTWRKGSGEFTSSNIIYWLSSILYSCDLLKQSNFGDLYLNIFTDAALVWLFGLKRENFALTDFYESLLNRQDVKELLKRPLCDGYFIERDKTKTKGAVQ